jgi:hypothetical protein
MGKQVNGDLAKEDRRAFVALDRRHSTVSRRPKDSMNVAGKLARRCAGGSGAASREPFAAPSLWRRRKHGDGEAHSFATAPHFHCGFYW